MSEQASSAESGNIILQIFAHLNAQPSGVLHAHHFTSAADTQGIPIETINAGLEYASEQGWITRDSNGSFKLTDLGYGKVAGAAT